MNAETEKQIVEELQKHTAMLEKVTRDNRRGMFTALTLLVILVVGLPLYRHFSSCSKSVPQALDSWERARTLHYEGNLSEAEKMIRRLVTKYPKYDYGYTLLAHCQQQLGNIAEAEVNYAKAYELFPSEDNEKNLTAIRKAIEKKK